MAFTPLADIDQQVSEECRLKLRCVCSVLTEAHLMLVSVEDLFYKPKGHIIIGASARGYKFGSTVVRRACVTVAAESESPVAIEALDAVDLNDDLANALVTTNSSIGKGSEFLGRLKSYSLSFKSAVAEKLSAPSAASENTVESSAAGSFDDSEHIIGSSNGPAGESQSGSSSLMSSMMTKALQAAASVTSDYRGGGAASITSLPQGSPPAELLTSMLSDTSNELRTLLATSPLITTQFYHSVTKLVRIKLSGEICMLRWLSACCNKRFLTNVHQVCCMNFYVSDSKIAGEVRSQTTLRLFSHEALHSLHIQAYDVPNSLVLH